MPKYPHPVIFLPGIMGSALRDQYSVEPQTVWSPFKMFIKSYERITVHPSAERIGCVAPRAELPGHPTVREAFAREIAELRRQGR